MKEEKPTRLAIVNYDLCKPKNCAYECKKACPVNRIGKPCIEIKPQCNISEVLCIGCSACAKKCPFKAITIVNLPTSLEKEVIHRYGKNLFKLHRLPILKKGLITGLVGTNGIGKSTALNILSGIIKPNLGKEDANWQEIINNFKGSELHSYFMKLLDEDIKITLKSQYIDKLPDLLIKEYKKEDLKVKEIKELKEENEFTSLLGINALLEKEIRNLSGGELQRLFICISCLQKSQVYLFDEPTSYLDVKQRLSAAKAIRKLDNNFVLVVEHDLAILDLMSDNGCVIYGVPGAYGVISKPFSIKNAINIFLDGFIPTENMKFRDEPLKFIKTNLAEKKDFSVEESLLNLEIKEEIPSSYFSYENKKITLGDFSLEIKGSTFDKSEVILFLGENGMGKTTFVNALAQKNSVSIKPQKILPKFGGTVREIFLKKIKSAFSNPNFYNEVIKPLGIEYSFDQSVQKLSGGELQRIALILCLGKPANIYLLDEPSAYLDADQRITISKIIKKFVYQNKVTAFLVEHDLIVGTYLADKVVVFEGVPGKKAVASGIMPLEEGMNLFLKNLNITFRREQNTFRPRVNKPDSQKDREQKEMGKYFF